MQRRVIEISSKNPVTSDGASTNLLKRFWAPRIRFPSSFPVTAVIGFLYSVVILPSIRNPLTNPYSVVIEGVLFTIFLPAIMRFAWQAVEDVHRAFPIIDFLEGKEFIWSGILVSRDRLDRNLRRDTGPSPSAREYQILLLFMASFFVLMSFSGFGLTWTEIYGSANLVCYLLRALYIGIWAFTILTVYAIAHFYAATGLNLFSDISNLSMIDAAQEFEMAVMEGIKNPDEIEIPSQESGKSVSDFLQYAKPLSSPLQRASLASGICYPLLFAMASGIAFGEALGQLFFLLGWVTWALILAGIIYAIYPVAKLELSIHRCLSEYKMTLTRSYTRLLERAGRQIATGILKQEPQGVVCDEVQAVKALLEEAKSIDTWIGDTKTMIVWMFTIILPIALTILQVYQSFT